MTPPPRSTSLRVFTIGHSTRSSEAFLALLKENGVGVVADVRRYPSSRKFPHFNQGALRDFLEAQGISYVWFEALGGRRHGGKSENSPNSGLKSPGFRHYADYMMTEPFREAVERLLSVAQGAPTCVMCAERLYWKCHRRLLSDYLNAQGVEVVHILESGRLEPHKLTPGATIAEEGRVVYPSSGSRVQRGLFGPSEHFLSRSIRPRR